MKLIAMIPLLFLLVSIGCGGDSSSTPSPQDTSPTQTTLKSDTDDLALSVSLVSNWEVGDVRNLTLYKERLQSDKDDVSSSVPVTMTVLEKSLDGYVIEWKYGQIQLEDESMMADPTVAAIFSLYDGMRLEYDVDEFGIFGRLRNLEEVESQAKIAVDLMIQMLEDAGIDETQIAGMREIVEPMTSGEAAVSQQLQEIQLYHLALGFDFEPNEPITYSDLLPNPFGGDPFPSEVEWWVNSRDLETDTVIVKWTQMLDSTSARDIMLDTLRQMAKAMNADEPAEDDLPSPFEISDAGEYAIEISTGWVLSMDHRREIISGSSTRVDIIRVVDETGKAS